MPVAGGKRPPSDAELAVLRSLEGELARPFDEARDVVLRRGEERGQLGRVRAARD